MSSNDAPTTQEIGELAEIAALKFLEKKGMILQKKNYNCKVGEIDLIMKDADYYVFVEVRMRKHQSYGSGLDSVIPQKQNRIHRAATHYLMTNNLIDKADCRFDIISIDKFDNIHWIDNAFEVAF